MITIEDKEYNCIIEIHDPKWGWIAEKNQRFKLHNVCIQSNLIPTFIMENLKTKEKIIIPCELLKLCFSEIIVVRSNDN